MKSDDLSVSELCSHLAAELVDRRQAGQIPELRALAPVIDRMLAEHNEDDEVSLGLLEPLTWRALDGTIEPKTTREALGPSARGVWDSLYLGARQQDLRAVEYEQSYLGAAAKIPAQLEEWLVHARHWVDAGTPVARLTVSAGAAQLKLSARCWIDRLAAPAKHPLEAGELLLYVAPETPGMPKNQPLVTLVLSGPAA
jgi:hypothetical protein